MEVGGSPGPAVGSTSAADSSTEMGLMPTSSTTAPGRTQSRFTRLGTPTATTTRSASRTASGTPSATSASSRSRHGSYTCPLVEMDSNEGPSVLRLTGSWITLTEATPWSRRSTEMGMPMVLELPSTTVFMPFIAMPDLERSSRQPRAVQGRKKGWRPRIRRRPMFSGWKPSTSLPGSSASYTASSRMWSGTGSCTSTPCTCGSRQYLATVSTTSFWVTLVGRLAQKKVDSRLLACLPLLPHVQHRVRALSNEDHRKPWNDAMCTL
mmetsp:Transcript_24020/g.52425  ORF Transcript_24020/g.52425 Transcript_24020/m.52425 type:complete len:266 (-) Transcript_24020:622-1419(-)